MQLNNGSVFTAGVQQDGQGGVTSTRPSISGLRTSIFVNLPTRSTTEDDFAQLWNSTEAGGGDASFRAVAGTSPAVQFQGGFRGPQLANVCEARGSSIPNGTVATTIAGGQDSEEEFELYSESVIANTTAYFLRSSAQETHESFHDKIPFLIAVRISGMAFCLQLTLYLVTHPDHQRCGPDLVRESNIGVLQRLLSEDAPEALKRAIELSSLDPNQKQMALKLVAKLRDLPESSWYRWTVHLLRLSRVPYFLWAVVTPYELLFSYSPNHTPQFLPSAYDRALIAAYRNGLVGGSVIDGAYSTAPKSQRGTGSTQTYRITEVGAVVMLMVVGSATDEELGAPATKESLDKAVKDYQLQARSPDTDTSNPKFSTESLEIWGGHASMCTLRQKIVLGTDHEFTAAYKDFRDKKEPVSILAKPLSEFFHGRLRQERRPGSNTSSRNSSRAASPSVALGSDNNG